MVGNGDYLRFVGQCSDVSIKVNQYYFQIPFYLLSIQGADVVLGVQWLQTLGPILSDFTVPSMQFYQESNMVTLHGSPTPSLSSTTFHQFNRMLQISTIVTCHAISMIPSTTSNTTHTPLSQDLSVAPPTHPDMTNLLNQYSQIFN